MMNLSISILRKYRMYLMVSHYYILFEKFENIEDKL
jgi:hypothetical protein